VNKEENEIFNNLCLGDKNKILDYMGALDDKKRYSEELEIYKQALLDIKEYIENRFDQERGMWIIDCYELLNIVNKAIGVDKE
jgi:regulator of sigma D